MNPTVTRLGFLFIRGDWIFIRSKF